MRTFILVCMCVVLIGSVIMTFMVLKEKERKGAAYAYVALFIATIIIALGMMIKMLGVW